MHPNVLVDVVQPPPGVAAGDPLHQGTLVDPHREESSSFPHRRGNYGDLAAVEDSS